MSGWVPVVVAAGIGLLTLWYMKRQRIVEADRPVLDDIRNEIVVKYHKHIEVARNQAEAGVQNLRRMRVMASDLSVAWAALEAAAAHIGRLSRLRYDGLRPLAHRIQDACESTASDRQQLEALASGTATAPERLAAALPWPSLGFDALAYGALASIYRREGPLTPRSRDWWRLPSKREANDSQIFAPIAHRVRKKTSQPEDVLTSIAEVRELIRSESELSHLSDPEVNTLAYQILHSDTQESSDGSSWGWKH